MPAALQPGWEDATPCCYHEFIDSEARVSAPWWNSDWIAAPDNEISAPDDGDFEPLGHGLAHFRSDASKPVTLQGFLGLDNENSEGEQRQTTVRQWLVT